jgi:hypothetical protein
MGFFRSFPETSSFVNEATAATPLTAFPQFLTAVASLVGQFSKLFLDGSEVGDANDKSYPSLHYYRT